MTQYLVHFKDGTMQMTNNYGEYIALKGFSGENVDDGTFWFAFKVVMIPFLIFLLICCLVG